MFANVLVASYITLNVQIWGSLIHQSSCWPTHPSPSCGTQELRKAQENSELLKNDWRLGTIRLSAPLNGPLPPSYQHVSIEACEPRLFMHRQLGMLWPQACMTETRSIWVSCWVSWQFHAFLLFVPKAILGASLCHVRITWLPFALYTTLPTFLHGFFASDEQQSTVLRCTCILVIILSKSSNWANLLALSVFVFVFQWCTVLASCFGYWCGCQLFSLVCSFARWWISGGEAMKAPGFLFWSLMWVRAFIGIPLVCAMTEFCGAASLAFLKGCLTLFSYCFLTCNLVELFVAFLVGKEDVRPPENPPLGCGPDNPAAQVICLCSTPTIICLLICSPLMSMSAAFWHCHRQKL